MNIAITKGPKGYKKVSNDSEWVKAMQNELHALERNGIWTLCSLPEGKSAVGCNWEYKIKRNSDGSIERHKTRLVAK